MINIIWLVLLLTGIIVAAIQGKIEVVTKAALGSAQSAVEVSIGLIAIMTFWLGIMKIAEAAGFVRVISNLVKPITSFLFPGIPKNHPALGAIIMNISANILGLSNAATPFGLIAMQEMQKLNKKPDTATDAMCTFLAINTSCITLIPATVIGIRMKFGSANPTEIVGTTIFATACGTIVAVLVDWFFRMVNKNKLLRR